jgi:hypothetical protein
LSLAANVNGLRQEKNREWLAWLSALENVLGPRILGAPLLRWNEISPGVFSVQYGSVDLTSNTNASPYPLDPETTLSPYGFYAVDHGPDPASAGSLDRFEGKDYTGGTAFIRHGSELIRGPEAATPGISRTAP